MTAGQRSRRHHGPLLHGSEQPPARPRGRSGGGHLRPGASLRRSPADRLKPRPSWTDHQVVTDEPVPRPVAVEVHATWKRSASMLHRNPPGVTLPPQRWRRPAPLRSRRTGRRSTGRAWTVAGAGVDATGVAGLLAAWRAHFSSERSSPSLAWSLRRGRGGAQQRNGRK